MLKPLYLEQELRARDQERQEIAEALSPLDFMGTVQNDTLVQREPGTGEWFLETKEFKEWVNGTQKFLWCPGIRKLTLAKRDSIEDDSHCGIDSWSW